jgi:outer membrane protein TolC
VFVVVAAQKAFDGVSEEANLGSRTTLDVLNSEQELLSARTARLEAGLTIIQVYFNAWPSWCN